jgi:hemoglobin
VACPELAPLKVPGTLDRQNRPCDGARMASIFEAAGGEAGLMRLAEAWHRRVLADKVVSHAFEHGYHPDHTRRLAAYWTEALGGPPVYTQALGSESAVVRMHSGEGLHGDMDQRAVACFAEALDDAGLNHEPLRTALHDYFLWATSYMSRYPDSPDDVPAGLHVPLWSWEGLAPSTN